MRFGCNALFKCCWLQCLGFKCLSKSWDFLVRVGESLKAKLVFFPLLRFQVSGFSSQETHKSSYQSKTRPTFLLCVSCVKNSRGCRRCWCTRVHVDDPERIDAPHSTPPHRTVPSGHPGEKLGSVTAAHTRWLSKKGQVVVQSAAQSSVDAAHADILPSLDRCRERKNLLFHMLGLVATLSSTHCPPHHPPLALRNPFSSSLNQMAPSAFVYLGWRSQMQSVSIGIPIPPSCFLSSFLSFPLSWSAAWPPPLPPDTTPLRLREGDTPFNTPFYPRLAAF